ncbi:toluene-tolerance protein [Oleiphilus messinensis]|uniref:Toluene-tolerance protein n=1 Tax=Oleiphilus messinensis TaxID=141451 RepID=A0A1Y0I662_9GAMM|nr:BolA/IbaG family iron-sulfur metabolism protein [Oleiphilus messinensis]ARU55977.1 toluene-tolerance protein [Oleiphilus messinensis]
MQAQQLQALIQAKLADCEVTVDGEGSSFNITVVGEVFRGMSPVKKQQLVYGCFDEYLKSGEIHAVTMQTRTPE